MNHGTAVAVVKFPYTVYCNQVNQAYTVVKLVKSQEGLVPVPGIVSGTAPSGN